MITVSHGKTRRTIESVCGHESITGGGRLATVRPRTAGYILVIEFRSNRANCASRYGACTICACPFLTTLYSCSHICVLELYILISNFMNNCKRKRAF